MSVTYKSVFKKADMRKEQSIANGKCFLAQNNDKVSLKDIFLSADASLPITLSPEHLHIIFPIAGALFINEKMEISAEEIFCYHGVDEHQIVITNPFPNETINFFHITIDKSAHHVDTIGASVSPININQKNLLFQGDGMASCMMVGVYDSRTKDRLLLNIPSGGLFTYVINGSFDFEERLMEYRDGLYQWDVNEVDFEALSEAAIILLINC